MGPSMSIDGVVEQPRAVIRHARASMGPSMSIDGVRRGGQGRRRDEGRFNGAVDEHRRSPRRPAVPARRAPPASMGPSMSIDGVTVEHQRPAVDRDRASMGPSMSIDGVMSAPAPPIRVGGTLQWGRR